MLEATLHRERDRGTRGTGRVRRVGALALLLLATPGLGRAQTAVEFVIASPPSPVGAGARAAGTGSAFIALADDATAASWNPAGLIQLERPELSAVGLVSHQIDRVGSSAEQQVVNDLPKSVLRDVGTDSVTAASLNYLSAALPFAFRGRNVVVSLNYQQTLAFERSFDLVARDTTSTLAVEVDRSFEQSGGVYAASPAVAIELTPDLSAGVAVNYWFDGLGRSHAWQQVYRDHFVQTSSTGTTELDIYNADTFRSFRGTNATFGALWKPGREWAFGAFVELPFTARLTKHIRFRSDEVDFEDREELRMRFPLSWGAGASWRPTDRWVLSLDVTLVDWSEFRIVDSAGREFLITGEPEESSKVDDVVTVRGGTEYLLLFDAVAVALRGGAFYDPEPSRGAPEDFFGVSTGVGLSFEDFSIDLAYVLRFGLDVSGTSITQQIFDLREGDLDSFQNLFYLSAVTYF